MDIKGKGKGGGMYWEIGVETYTIDTIYEIHNY